MRGRSSQSPWAKWGGPPKLEGVAFVLAIRKLPAGMRSRVMPTEFRRFVSGLLGSSSAAPACQTIRRPSARTSSSSPGTMTTTGLRVLKFGRPLPPDAQLRILVATPRALATVPVALRDVALP